MESSFPYRVILHGVSQGHESPVLFWSKAVDEYRKYTVTTLYKSQVKWMMMWLSISSQELFNSYALGCFWNLRHFKSIYPSLIIMEENLTCQLSTVGKSASVFACSERVFNVLTQRLVNALDLTGGADIGIACREIRRTKIEPMTADRWHNTSTSSFTDMPYSAATVQTRHICF